MRLTICLCKNNSDTLNKINSAKTNSIVVSNKEIKEYNIVTRYVLNNR